MSLRTRHCLYCLLRVDGDNYLHCKDCDKDVHITCLKRPGTPGDIVGDVFFEFRCSHCTDDGKEEFERTRLPWAMLVVLALHNLSVQSMGLSHQGYFHWRTHVACFIEKNWNHLIGANVKQKKKWIGTISGTLSHNTPAMFSSGFNVFNEGGWWKLTQNLCPKQYMEFYHAQRTEKSKADKTTTALIEQKANEPTDVAIEDDVDIMTSSAKRFRPDVDVEPEIFSRSIPYMGRIPWKSRIKTEEIPSSIEADLSEFLSSHLLSEDLADLDLTSMSAIADDPECEALLPGSRTSTHSNDWPDHFLGLDIFNSVQTPARSESVVESEEEIFEPRIVQVTNFQAGDRDYEEDTVGGNAQSIVYEEVVQTIKRETPEEDDEEEEKDYDTKYPQVPSLFKISTKRRLPWLDDSTTVDLSEYENGAAVDRMSAYEEGELLGKLRLMLRNCDAREESQVPHWVRRFYRKLCVRETKRNLGKPIFDLDDFVLGRNRTAGTEKTEAQVLDRYHHLVCGSNRIKREGVALSLHSRLAGGIDYELFESPHTGRILHPFIFRNSEQMPPWVKLMVELQYTVNGSMPERATIDYCYVRPHHIAAINGLLQKTFWPGIDMSECLSYPEFSIVALYKRLVIGCAFLVPDVGHNNAYVSFMTVRNGWQRAGIASFMLYHLTQTCMGKDITLHVSATNSAICLYQKFGFKMEEVVLDFYDKYLPIDSPHSRHAFFLRLRR